MCIFHLVILSGHILSNHIWQPYPLIKEDIISYIDVREDVVIDNFKHMLQVAQTSVEQVKNYFSQVRGKMFQVQPLYNVLKVAKKYNIKTKFANP